MKKRFLLSLIAISFSTYLGFVLLSQPTAVFAIKVLDKFTPYEVVNFHKDSPLASRFLVPHNESVQERYGDQKFPLKSNKEVGVCIIDNFKVQDELNHRGSHGENVTKLINKRYDGDIYKFNVDELSYQNHKFSECDVINYSMSIHKEHRLESTFDSIDRFMKKYKGIMVVSAGNEGYTTTKSEWSAYLEEFGEPEWWNRIIVVAQGRLVYNQTAELEKVNVTSYGKEIDFIVFNSNEYVANDILTGSSFATPIITSAVANYLSVGVPTSEIKALLKKSTDSFTDQYKYTYSDFRVDKSNETLVEYLKEEALSFQYK